MIFVGTVNCQSLNSTLWLVVEVFRQFRVSGTATDQLIELETKTTVKFTHHTLRPLAGWKKIVLLPQSCVKQRFGLLFWVLCLILGAKTSYVGFYREKGLE